jgi:hypothetical protein
MSVPAVSDPLMRSDEKPLAEYRSVSKLAVAAILCGVASALVLVGPLLLPVALAAIVVSVLALRAIAASEGQLVGRLPALLGLSLAVLFLGWGGSRYVTRQTQLETHARAFCESWLTMMADGQYRHAHQLELPSPQRIFSEEAQEEYYAGDYEASDRLQARISQPPMDAFVAEGQDVRYRFERLAKVQTYGHTDYVTLQYTIERPAERGGPRPMWIQVQRTSIPVSGVPEWMLVSVMDKDPGGT